MIRAVAEDGTFATHGEITAECTDAQMGPFRVPIAEVCDEVRQLRRDGWHVRKVAYVNESGDRSRP